MSTLKIPPSSTPVYSETNMPTPITPEAHALLTPDQLAAGNYVIMTQKQINDQMKGASLAKAETAASPAYLGLPKEFRDALSGTDLTGIDQATADEMGIKDIDSDGLDMGDLLNMILSGNPALAGLVSQGQDKDADQSISPTYNNARNRPGSSTPTAQPEVPAAVAPTVPPTAPPVVSQEAPPAASTKPPVASTGVASELGLVKDTWNTESVYDASAAQQAELAKLGFGFGKADDASAKEAVDTMKGYLNDKSKLQELSAQSPKEITGKLEDILQDIQADGKITKEENNKFAELFGEVTKSLSQFEKHEVLEKLGRTLGGGNVAEKNLLTDLVGKSNPKVVNGLTGDDRVNAATAFVGGLQNSDLTQLIGNFGSKDSQMTEEKAKDIGDTFKTEMGKLQDPKDKSGNAIAMMQQLIRNSGLSEANFWDKMHAGQLDDVCGAGTTDLVKELYNAASLPADKLEAGASNSDIAEKARNLFQANSADKTDSDGIGWGDAQRTVEGENGQDKAKSILKMAGYGDTKAELEQFLKDLEAGTLRNGADGNAALDLINKTFETGAEWSNGNWTEEQKKTITAGIKDTMN